jgi:microcystin-dependent protein
MANLKETSFWEEGIYQWETSDPVLGGENGIDNVPTRQLANRTKWLKDNKLDKSATATNAANAELAKRALTADKLTNARKVGGVAFDGSADIDLPGVNKPGNQNTSGNAATASKLFKPCKIGGVVFDGTRDIDLPGVNVKGNQHTFGNAGSAFRLYNPRKINDVPFDGTQDINVTPAGAVQFFAISTAPVGWLKANGAAVSRTLYANLFAVIGTSFGAGDGKTTFNLPDLRGEFLRGWDDGRGVDTGRRFGDTQADAIRNIVGQSEPLHTQTLGNSYDKNIGAFKSIRYTLPGGSINAGASNDMTIIGFDASLCVPTANENRPRNVNLLACIKI